MFGAERNYLADAHIARAQLVLEYIPEAGRYIGVALHVSRLLAKNQVPQLFLSDVEATQIASQSIELPLGAGINLDRSRIEANRRAHAQSVSRELRVARCHPLIEVRRHQQLWLHRDKAGL